MKIMLQTKIANGLRDDRQFSSAFNFNFSYIFAYNNASLNIDEYQVIEAFILSECTYCLVVRFTLAFLETF